MTNLTPGTPIYWGDNQIGRVVDIFPKGLILVYGIDIKTNKTSKDFRFIVDSKKVPVSPVVIEAGFREVREEEKLVQGDQVFLGIRWESVVPEYTGPRGFYCVRRKV